MDHPIPPAAPARGAPHRPHAQHCQLPLQRIELGPLGLNSPTRTKP